MTNLLNKYADIFHDVVAFDPSTEKLVAIDLTQANKELNSEIVADTNRFSDHISLQLQKQHARFGIGGYAEHRTVYSRSVVFDGEKSGDEPRRLHLGTDIWGPAGTRIYAPMGGMVHSFAFNNQFGDYGATLILLHQLDGLPFYSLYGHISLRDIDHLTQGQYVVRGEEIGHFGEPHENGQWPPHLHFQLIGDLGLYSGDYPGVCKYSEREQWLANSPDPDAILQLNKYL